MPLSRATTDSAWLLKQLENGSSRPRAFEAAEKGKHAYPRQWASNKRWREELHRIILRSQQTNSAQHSWIAPARQKCTAFTY